ncbi:hypothetical protein ABZP36_031485 [Zizania latifolia]
MTISLVHQDHRMQLHVQVEMDPRVGAVIAHCNGQGDPTSSVGLPLRQSPCSGFTPDLPPQALNPSLADGTAIPPAASWQGTLPPLLPPCLNSSVVAPVIAGRAVNVVAPTFPAIDSEWTDVRGKRSQKIQRGLASSSISSANHPTTTTFNSLRQNFAGCCFRCLSRSHLVVNCRDPIKCLGCLHSGHKSSRCSLRYIHPVRPRFASTPLLPIHPARPSFTNTPLLPSSVSLSPTTTPLPSMETMVTHEQCPASVQCLLKASIALDHTERRLMRHAAFAAVVGPRSASSATHVKHRLTKYLRVQPNDVEVFAHPGGSFLVYFARSEDRTVALSETRLSLRGLELKLIPWSRRAQASFAKLCFRARLCLEGVPRHAWNSDTMVLLLSDGCLFDKVDDSASSEKESACLCVWVWTQDANRIPKLATLQIAELDEHLSPPRNFPEFDFTETPAQRGPPNVLLYNILIRLDTLLDYDPPMSQEEPFFTYSPYSAVVSGLDSPVSSEDEVPRKLRFHWELSVVDAEVALSLVMSLAEAIAKRQDGENQRHGDRRRYGDRRHSAWDSERPTLVGLKLATPPSSPRRGWSDQESPEHLCSRSPPLRCRGSPSAPPIYEADVVACSLALLQRLVQQEPRLGDPMMEESAWEAFHPSPSDSPPATPSPPLVRMDDTSTELQPVSSPFSNFLDSAFTQVDSPLMASPPPPLLPPPPPIQTNRRSVRLASKPALGSMQKAQLQLMRKMGIMHPQEGPSERAMEQYLDLFKGPLTDAAMEAILSLASLSI